MTELPASKAKPAAGEPDPLTGLAGRQAFANAVEGAIERARSARGFALLLLDCGAPGEQTDDASIRAVAECLRAHVRATDLVARLGGTVFAILGGDVATAEDATGLAARMVDVVKREGRCGTISIGVAFCNRCISTAARQLSRADVALYRARANGGGHWLFTEATVAALHDRVATEEGPQGP